MHQTYVIVVVVVVIIIIIIIITTTTLNCLLFDNIDKVAHFVAKCVHEIRGCIQKFPD